MADTRTPASRRAASNASASRLPSARERRPALAALAVLLIVGGAFASGFLALQAGNRADYLRVSVSVPQGTEITEEHLESVSLPEDMDGVISVDSQDDVVGMRTVAPLVEGTILTEEMLTEESAIEEGMEEIAFGLESSDVDPTLEEGAAIKVYAVSDDGEDTDSYDATLVSVDHADEGGSIGGDGGSDTVLVKVLMDTGEAAQVQAAIQDDRVSIGETSPEEDTGNGGGNGE
jgi:hypothetical protein